MKELIVKGKTHLLLDKDDFCPICWTPIKDMAFRWNMFHGEATSDCCGAVYQLKDYHIDDPTDEEKELLDDLAGDYIEFKIKQEWIEPLKKAIQKTGIKDINNEEVERIADDLHRTNDNDNVSP